MRQLLNKADGIGNRHAATAGQTIRTRRRVERSKQLVLRKYHRAGQTIEQRRFTGIGITGQRDAKRR